MKNIFGLLVYFFLITISFPQESCILGDVYVNEAANRGYPEDYIEVYNGGTEECTLSGFQLDDSEELEDFTFGEIILSPGDFWLGYEDSTDSFSSGLGGEGDSIVFADTDGNVLITIVEESLETLDGVELSQSYGSDGAGCYTLPTPGELNVDCYEFIIGCTDSDATNYDPDANADDGSCEYSTASCILGEVYVSEAANRGDPEDFIGVYNSGSEECTLAGFQLDDSEELEDFTFGYVILAPDGYWHCFEDAEDCFRSGLDADGDIVVFADEDGNMLTIILRESIETEDEVELSQSYGSNGVGCYTLPTPGYINDHCFCTVGLGNLNGDDSWNVLDIVALANCVLTNTCTDITYSCEADINGDVNWNVLDIVALANCVLAQNCDDNLGGGRVDDASESRLILNGNIVSIEAEGFIGGVQMTLTHGDDFTIDMTDQALHADYITEGNETRLLVISPETEDLFSYSGDFEIAEIIVANSHAEVSVDLPLAASFSLSDAYPNPFNPTTTMKLFMPVAGDMQVAVYNLMGQVVATLASGYWDMGTYTLTWDATDVSSGMYFVKAQADGFTKTQKLMLVK